MMKSQNESMKHILLFLFFVLNTQISFAQDCYQTFLNEGIQAYDALDFEKAINQFKAAQICDDTPANNEISNWIEKAQNGYIVAIQKEQKKSEVALAKANSLYFARLSQQALENGDLILAYRFLEIADSLDQNLTVLEQMSIFSDQYGELFDGQVKYLMCKKIKTKNGSILLMHTDENEILVKYDDEYIRQLLDILGENYVNSISNELKLRVEKVIYKEVSDVGLILAFITSEGEGVITDIVFYPEEESRFRFCNKTQSMEFVEDQKELLCVCEDEIIKLVDVSYPFNEISLTGFESEIIKAAKSNDGRLLMGISKKGLCKIYDCETDSLIVSKNVGIGNVIDASFSSDSKQIIFISEADRILLTDTNLNLESRVEIIPVQSKETEMIDKVIMSEEGEYVLVLLNGKHNLGAILYNRKGEIVHNIKHEDLNWNILEISREESLLVFRENGKVNLLKLEGSKKDNFSAYSKKMREMSLEEKLRFKIRE